MYMDLGSFLIRIQVLKRLVLKAVLTGWLFLKAVLYSSVTATAIDKVALIWCRANAATITCIGRTTALGLALIVLEHKEIVGAEVEWGVVAL
jgi:hypothetical protein